MSQRDKRFKNLKWELNLTNTAWKAEALGRTYYVVKVEGVGYLAIHGVEFSTIYFYLSDARTMCQLAHEAYIKGYME